VGSATTPSTTAARSGSRPATGRGDRPLGRSPVSGWNVNSEAIEPVPPAAQPAVAEALRGLLTVVTMFETVGQLEDGVIDVYRHEQVWLMYRVWVEPHTIEVLSSQLA
jgi:hypothetical protein